MGVSLPFRLLLVFGTMVLGAMGMYYRESQYKALDLQGDGVAINVISEIPGDITWITTNEKQVSMAVKVSAPSFHVLNSTKVSFIAEGSFASLEIRSTTKQEVSAVHSTGSRITTWAGRTHFVALLFPMTLFVSFDRRIIHVFLLVLVFIQICLTASLNVQDPDHKVNITIRSPRNFRYKSINLVINNGTIRVTNEIYKYSQDVHCSTELSTRGCDGCCHGNGVCFNNTCMCEEIYDANTECKNIKKRDIFFINSFDPRIEKTILPNGLVFDLSTADNSRDIRIRGKNQNHSKLRVRNMAASSKDGMFHFNENGLLKRARHGKVSFVLRKRKDSNCFIDLVLKKFGIRIENFTLDLCNNSGSENKTTDDYRSIFNISEYNNTTQNILSINEMLYREHFKFREIKIKFERCGYTNQNDVSIYFKVQNEVEKVELKKFYKDDIYLHTVYRKDRHFLKIPSRNVSEKEIQRKCQRSLILRNNICRQDHVTFYKFVCDSIIDLDTNYTDGETISSINISEAVSACNFLLETLKTFCPSISLIDKYSLTSQSTCLSRYTETVDLFSREYLNLSPIIILKNGELVQKESVIYPILINSSRTTRTEIILKEDIPEFKILKIAVIPNDPVPGDIYKVRLDYTCATNETVIQMSVTGSDKYNSHVTCRGLNDCNCCSVHAAGAADAVIDYVSINITDQLTKTDLHKEMVVIF